MTNLYNYLSFFVASFCCDSEHTKIYKDDRVLTLKFPQYKSGWKKSFIFVTEPVGIIKKIWRLSQLGVWSFGKNPKLSLFTVGRKGREDLNSSYSINQNVQILKSVNYMLSSPRCEIIKKNTASTANCFGQMKLIFNRNFHDFTLCKRP